MHDCEQRVLDYLTTLAGKYAVVDPSIGQMMIATGYGRRRVQMAVKHLIDNGYITRTMHGAVNSKAGRAPIYALCEVSHAPPILSTAKTFKQMPWLTGEYTSTYWQDMVKLEQNTEAWCKARRVASANAPAPQQQQIVQFPPDPEWYACFFWDDTHEQAA